MAGPSPGSDDHIRWQSHLPVGDVKIVSPINIITVVLNTVTLKIKCKVGGGVGEGVWRGVQFSKRLDFGVQL